MREYDAHAEARSPAEYVVPNPDNGDLNFDEEVAAVSTISLRQTRISGPKSRSLAFMSILIVFCILGIVAGITILLVGRGAMSSINTNTQTESLDADHPELSLATEQSTEVMSDVEILKVASNDVDFLEAASNDLDIFEAESNDLEILSSVFPTYQPIGHLTSGSAISSSWPSVSPSTTPSSSPSVSPSSKQPTPAPFLPIVLGKEMYQTNENFGIHISMGISAKLIATSGRRVKYGNGNESSRPLHWMMDAAGIVSLRNGGYVYVSNSEEECEGDGGVYGLYFDDDGRVVDYKALLTGTTKNCGGGLSPWNTWISCEEVDSWGQCWQVDPDPSSEYHQTPMRTLLGGSGGTYESTAVDNTDPQRPIFFVTEDHESGALRRFIADGNGWDSLHHGGSTTFLYFIDDNTFEWTSNENAGRASAERYYPNTEGISYHDGYVYFVSKEMTALFILDLKEMTYKRELTGGPKLSGHGSFNSQPDQIVLATVQYMYFSEDGGRTPGVYVRDKNGIFFTIFQGIEGAYYDDETVGIALTPDRKRLYAGFQDAGVLFEFTRDDGMSFE